MRYAQPTVDRSDLGGRALALAQQDGQLRVCRLQCRVVLGKELPGCEKDVARATSSTAVGACAREWQDREAAYRTPAEPVLFWHMTTRSSINALLTAMAPKDLLFSQVKSSQSHEKHKKTRSQGDSNTLITPHTRPHDKRGSHKLAW